MSSGNAFNLGQSKILSLGKELNDLSFRFALQVAVYHTLAFSDLTPVYVINNTIKEIQARRAGALAVSRLRGFRKKKADEPAILNIYNKVVNKPVPSAKRYGQGSRIKKVAEKFQGPLTGKQSSPESSKASKKKKEQSETGKEAPVKIQLESGDASGQFEVLESEADEDDASMIHNGSSTSGSFSAGSKVEFKLPSIVE